MKAPGGGGGYLVYLFEGDVLFFRVSFSPIFLEQGNKRRQVFWSRLSKHVKRGNFCYNGLLPSQIFVFLSILFTDLFWNRVSFEGKNSGAG